MGPVHHNRLRHSTCMTLAAASVAVAVSSLVPAFAQSSMPAGSPGRFTMHPADGGVLRMDTQTGALSMCKQVAGSWTCAMLPDDRTAVTAEIDRLKTENAELKSSVKRLEDLAGVPGGTGVEPGEDKRHSGVTMPTEEDVDKAMSYVQRMLKKFKEKLRELEDPENPKRTRT